MLRLFVNVYSDPDAGRNEELKECLRRNSNLSLINEVIKLEGRPTFREFFVWANRVAEGNDITVIANSDIYFDETLQKVESLKHDQCFALSRWDVMSDGTAKLFDCAYSQDAWIFRGPLRIVASDFAPGVPNCDNHLAWLLNEAGYRLSNPSQTIRALHLHLSAVRRSNVPGAHLYIPSTAL